jgi:hypothetical protein
MSPFGDTRDPPYLTVLLRNSSGVPDLASPFSDIFPHPYPRAGPPQFIMLLFAKRFSLLAQGLL